MISYIASLMMVLAVVFGAKAQIVTSEPSPLQQNSENVVIYYHADQGNKKLINQPASSPIYAHTGVITNKSTSGSDWKHAPNWKDNSAKYKLEYVSTNLWKLNIGNIADYYQLEEGEVVKQLAFVFRDATASKEGKTAEGGDIFLDVFQEGLYVSLTADIDGYVIKEGKTSVTFTAAATTSASLSISINGAVVATQDKATSLSYTHNFSEYGNYTVAAKATAGGQEATDEAVFCYPTASVAKNYPGGVPKMGAVKNADGSVIFCLAAPQKTSAILVPSWENYNVMNHNVMNYHDYNGNRYFWVKVEGLEAGKQYTYYYLVDGQYKVGDPYAKLILDPYHDKYITESVYPDLIPYPTELGNVMLAVYDDDINDYDWEVTDFKGVDKSDLIIYEMLFRDFTGTEGKANSDGTIREAMKKISYLKRLGVNAVELMPIMEFNGNNSWGYNTNFYFAPDKAYGTPDDYKAFIDACHKEGIAVILDIVFNQSDGLHPWYQLYPVASNPFYNASAPHDYSVLNDWKQDNALVQQQFKDCLKYWLKEYKVDGFRFDLVKGLGDNGSYSSGTEAYNQSRIDRMKSLHAAMNEVNPNAYFINEHLAGSSEENEMAKDGEMNWANVNHSAAQFAMGHSSDSNLNRFYAINDSRTWGSTVSYCESHDEERMAYKIKQWGATGVKGNHSVSMRRLAATAAQMILAPGAHMIWQFQELGNDQTTKKSDGGNNTDPKIVNWSYLEDEDRKGLYDSYRDLCYLRSEHAEIFGKDASFSMSCGTSNWADGRFIYASKGDKELICVINPNITGTKTFNVTFKSNDNANYKIASQTYNTAPSFDAAAGTVTVPSNGYVVIVRQNMSGIDGVATDAVKTEVYAVGNQIIINGDYRNAEVYNTAGLRFDSLTVPAGIYIVRVDGQTFKVAVR